MANILSIGQSALAAAQAGLTTTGHNIANTNTEGYSRQIVSQGTGLGQDLGFGFIGGGTRVNLISRVYNQFLAGQVLSSQTSQSSLTAYSSRISQIDNLFADSTAGVAPAMQEFFASVQNLAANPSSGAARQSLLSSGHSMVGQFHAVSERLEQMRQGVNSDIGASVQNINSIATRIAGLNKAITAAQAASGGKPANDLLDQRDMLLSDLSKEVRVSVVRQGDDYNITIGNGQSLVVGANAFELATVASATDLSRLQVGYKTLNGVVPLADSALTGGKLGGILEFRSQTLDQVQNEIGRVAIGLASTFNAQHALGQDLEGDMGGDFFQVPAPQVNASAANGSNAMVAATITNAGALSASDYRFEYRGPGDYRVTRVADGAIYDSTTIPMSVDGVQFDITGGPAAPGDLFLIKPTANGAAGLGLAISNTADIAAAAPVRTAASGSNVGSGAISTGVVDSAFVPATVAPAVSLTFNSGGGGTLTGFPAVPVTVTSNGSSTVYPASTPVPYTAGATVSFGGVSFTLSGAPADGDTFTIGANSAGIGDNRNALLLGALQTGKTMANGTISFQTAYGQMVNMIGNKTHSVDVALAAENTLLQQAVNNQQADSGVNLDEEAVNLMRYQQAYQAAGKVMQAANTMFDTLLSLGG